MKRKEEQYLEFVSSKSQVLLTRDKKNPPQLDCIEQLGMASTLKHFGKLK
jgi:hypothetical protein